MTEVSKERLALQRGAAIHLKDALGKAQAYTQAGEKLQQVRKETQGWMDGVDEALLGFSQFQLSLTEVRDSGHAMGNWSDEVWQVVTDRLEAVSRGQYGKETPEQARKRDLRRELLELDDDALREKCDARLANISERLWEKGRHAVAEFLVP